MSDNHVYQISPAHNPINLHQVVSIGFSHGYREDSFWEEEKIETYNYGRIMRWLTGKIRSHKPKRVGRWIRPAIKIWFSSTAYDEPVRVRFDSNKEMFKQLDRLEKALKDMNENA